MAKTALLTGLLLLGLSSPAFAAADLAIRAAAKTEPKLEGEEARLPAAPTAK